MLVIDSPRNPRVQAAVALRDRATRLQSGRTLVDGARECRRAVDAGVAVETAFVCPALLRHPDAVAAVESLRAAGSEVIEVSERAHDRLAFGNRGDGLVLVVRTPPMDLEGLRPGPSPLILVTEDVEKPGNLGAILRTADGAGCDAVIAIGGTDLFNPNVIRASVGTVFSLPLAVATAAETLAWLRATGIRPIAARVEVATLYTAADLTGPLALVVGSEADGLSDSWRDPAIEGVSLTMRGVADSLNVSVAAAILTFEAQRQRDLTQQPARSPS